MRSDPVLDAVGLAEHDAHPAVIHPQRLGADLRHRRGDALSDRRPAGDQFDRAGRIDRHSGSIERAETALLDEDRQASPDQLAGFAAAPQIFLQRVPADPRERLVEQKRVVAGIVPHLGAERAQGPGKRHLLGRDQVAPANGDPIKPEPVGDRIDQPLAHEAAFETTRRPIGRRRRLVGQAKPADRAIGRNPIRAGQHRDRHFRDARTVGAHVGALVEDKFVLERQDAALFIDRDAGVVMLLARVIGRHQMLAPVLDPFDRAAEPHCGETDEEILRVELAPDAEAAAGIAFLEHHPGRTAAEHAGERVAVAVRHLRGAVQLDNVTRRIMPRQGAARLERHAAMPTDREIEADDRLRPSECGIDFPVFGAHDQRLGRNSGGEAARRRLGVEQRRQLVRLDRDQIGGILGEIGVGREYGRDRLADIAQPVPRQQRLAIRAQCFARRVAKIDRRQIGNVLAGPDRRNAGRRERGPNVHFAQHGMGVRRAHDPHVQLMRKTEIADKLAAPRHERRVLKSRDRPADNPSWRRFRDAAHGRRLARSSANAARTASTMFR